MARINKLSIIQELVKGLMLEQSREKIPTEVADKIIPVFNIPSPEKLIQVKHAIASDSTSATIHTCATDRDTYLVNFILTYSKDANATSLFSTITATPIGGSAVAFFRQNYPTASAVGQVAVGYFNSSFPIKLERGSTITVTNSTAIASIDTNGIAYFYEVEDDE